MTYPRLEEILRVAFIELTPEERENLVVTALIHQDVFKGTRLHNAAFNVNLNSEDVAKEFSEMATAIRIKETS